MDVSPPVAVGVVAYEGFDELDAVGPFEVLENAARRSDRVGAVSLLGAHGADAVRASHGLRVEPDGPLAGADPDLLVVPGGNWNDRAPTGAWAEYERGDLPDAVAARHADGATVAAVCTGGMLLAAGGLLDGRPAVTHRGALADLRETGAEVVDARVVDAGDVLTAGGVTAGLDLGFHLVRETCGDEVADDVADAMEYDPSDDVHRA